MSVLEDKRAGPLREWVWGTRSWTAVGGRPQSQACPPAGSAPPPPSERRERPPTGFEHLTTQNCLVRMHDESMQQGSRPPNQHKYHRALQHSKKHKVHPRSCMQTKHYARTEYLTEFSRVCRSPWHAACKLTGHRPTNMSNCQGTS